MTTEPVAGTDSRTFLIHIRELPAGLTETAQEATAVLRRRGLTLSARECLPPERRADGMNRAMARPALSIDAGELRGSLTASSPSPPGTDLDAARRSAQGRMRPLFDNERITRALAASGRGVDDAALWSSGAVAVELSERDVHALADELADVADIQVSRRLRLPPVVEVSNLPEAVRERRASSYGLDSIRALATWGAYGARGAGVTVGVLDTGVDDTHPDLVGKVVGWAEFDDHGREVPSSPHDSDRHGTHVAGTIAGGNASGQWIGVAPEAKLCCAKVLGPTGGTDTQILAGMNWMIEQQVDVINMSLGGLTLGPQIPPTYTEAIVQSLRQGIPVVTAIGNHGSQTSGSPGNDLFALAVGATDHRDCVAGFSGGRTQLVEHSDFIRPELLPLAYSKPDVSAPGVAVVSAVPGGGWAAMNGTSMATPHVAGALALLLSATDIKHHTAPEERAFLLSDLITGSVEELGEVGQDHRYGFGRVDVLRAIDFAKERGY